MKKLFWFLSTFAFLYPNLVDMCKFCSLTDVVLAQVTSRFRFIYIYKIQEAAGTKRGKETWEYSLQTMNSMWHYEFTTDYKPETIYLHSNFRLVLTKQSKPLPQIKSSLKWGKKIQEEDTTFNIYSKLQNFSEQSRAADFLKLSKQKWKDSQFSCCGFWSSSTFEFWSDEMWRGRQESCPHVPLALGLINIRGTATPEQLKFTREQCSKAATQRASWVLNICRCSVPAILFLYPCTENERKTSDKWTENLWPGKLSICKLIF
jgi:hypothetical protein